MSTLQTLVEHLQGRTDAIRLVSNKPLSFRHGTQQRTHGEPVSTRQLVQLLKASLPESMTAELSWGRSMRHVLEVGDELWEAEIQLTAQQEVQIELLLRERDSRTVINPTQGQALEAVLPTPTSYAATREVDQRALQELISAGDDVALIYSPLTAYHSAMKRAASELGYELRTSSDGEVVLEALKYTEFPLIVLHLGVSSSDPVFGAIATMEMDRRRKMFVCLVSPEVSTGDALEAFALSMDLCVAERDMEQFAKLLKKGVDARNRYVAVFHDSLRAAGKL